METNSNSNPIMVENDKYQNQIQRNENKKTKIHNSNLSLFKIQNAQMEIHFSGHRLEK